MIVDKAMTPVVDLQLATELSGVPDQGQLQCWVAAALAGDAHDAHDPDHNLAHGLAGTTELTIRIVDQAESAELNRRYRNRAGPTNVLSFPFEPPPGIEAKALGELPRLLGDLVVCAPVVEREAAEQNKPAASHWAHMVVHGILHLRGHDHIDSADATRMEALETAILRGLGFPPPYE